MSIRWLVAVSAFATAAMFACERRIDLGELPTESAANAGSSPVEEESEFPERLVFLSDFDSGDLAEWGIESARLETAGGVFSADAELAQNGRHSGKVMIDTLGEHVVLATQTTERELLIGLWLRVQDNYSTGNWPFLHVDQLEETGTTELWDLGFKADGNAEQHLFLWEKPVLAGAEDGVQVAEASEAFGVQSWVHVQVHLLAADDSSGFLRVFQNEKLVFEVTDRPTSLGSRLQFSFGSFVYDIEPLPAVLWLDTITVHTR